MEFDFNDAWILNSITNTETENDGAQLIDIIAYCDYSNHSIITISEINNSLDKLVFVNIILIQNNKFSINNGNYKDWWKKYSEKKRIYIFKAVEETLKFLNKSFPEIVYRKSNLKVSESDYYLALEIYRQKALEIITRMK